VTSISCHCKLWEKKPVQANRRILLNHDIGVLVRKFITGTSLADVSVSEIHWSSKHDRGRYQKTTEVTAVPITAYYSTRKRVIAIFSFDCCWPDLLWKRSFSRRPIFDQTVFPSPLTSERIYKAFYAQCDHIPVKRVLYLVPAILQQATSHRHLRSDKTNALFSEDAPWITQDTPERKPVKWDARISHVEVHLIILILFTYSIAIAMNGFSAWIWKRRGGRKSVKNVHTWRFKRLIDCR